MCANRIVYEAVLAIHNSMLYAGVQPKGKPALITTTFSTFTPITGTSKENNMQGWPQMYSYVGVITVPVERLAGFCLEDILNVTSF